MTTIKIDIGPLQRAVERLEEGLTLYQTKSDNLQIIRDGLIQRFEFTYEISHKNA